MSTSITQDLKQYKQENFLKPYLKSGLNVYTKQRKQVMSSVSFGNKTALSSIDPFDGWITNMTLRIELEALWKIGDCEAKTYSGYLNWVDSIGHALIEYIELKIGDKVIYNSSFPYGLWLDIYNELNDPNMKEWSLIGKNASINSLKIYEENKKILYVPLHLWFSKNLESALPYFKFSQNKDNINKLQLSIKLRNLNELILSTGNTSNNPNTANNRTIGIDIIYDTIEAIYSQESKTEFNIIKESIMNSNYYNYIEKIDYYNTSLTNNINIYFNDAPLKNLILVNQNNNRNKQDKTPLVNEYSTDINGNDWFNYGNTSTISSLNTNDTFETLNISYNGSSINLSDQNLDSIYYRKHTNIFFNKNIPQKHIYTVPFSITEYTKENIVNGYFNYDSSNTLRLSFTNIAPTSTLSIFTVSINKLIITKNGIIEINEWNRGFIENSINNLSKSLKKIEFFANKLELKNEISDTIELKTNIIKFKLKYTYLGEDESYIIKKIINKNIRDGTYTFSNIISDHILIIKNNLAEDVKKNTEGVNTAYITKKQQKINYIRSVETVLKKLESEYNKLLIITTLLSKSKIETEKNKYNTEIVTIKKKIEDIILSKKKLLKNIDINIDIEIDSKDIFKPSINYVIDYKIDEMIDVKPNNNLITHIKYTNISNKPKILFHSINLGK
jgi:hypothetical protein